MSRRGGRPNKRLPKIPEGEKRDAGVDRLRKKLATVADVERVLVLYRDQYHAPLEARIRFLELPLYKRWWFQLTRLFDWAHTRKQRFQRWLYIRRWSKIEKKGDHGGEGS